MNKLLLVLLLALPTLVLADESEFHGFIGAGGGSYKSQDQSESSQTIVMGLEVHQGSSLEIEATKIDQMTQYTFRIIGPIYSLGHHSLTFQVGYTDAHYDYTIGGQDKTISDGFATYGMGYQWAIAQHVRLRYQHNYFNVHEFADSGIDLGRPTEDQVTVTYVF